MSGADDVLRFTLQDAEGNPHDYVVELHDGREGRPVATRLKVIAASAGISLVAGKTDAIARLVDLVDDALVSQILAHTTRDGKPLTRDGGLSAEYAKAYRGNYQEADGVLWRAVEANGFFGSSPALKSTKLGQMWTRILARLESTSALPSEPASSGEESEPVSTGG